MAEYTDLLPLPFSPPTLLTYILDELVALAMVGDGRAGVA
jgi:hypothetical protein